MLKIFSGFCIVFLLLAGCVFSQEKETEGIVFDKETRYRLTRVRITNLRTKASVFNNPKGEFKISARPGDKISAFLEGYYADTLVYSSQTALLFYLKRMAIPLKEVLIQDSALSARKRYEEIRKQFNSLNRIGNNKDLLAIGNSGVGLSIDALWSAFSREGKNARRLSEIMERDYMNNYIDERFNKSLVTKTTGLTGDKLEIFMLNYRPSYYFVLGASEYDLLSYINIAYIRFQKNPYREDLSLLEPIEIK